MVKALNLKHLVRKKTLPNVSSPIEEIQLGFIGPITEKQPPILHTTVIVRFSKWLVASFCKHTKRL